MGPAQEEGLLRNRPEVPFLDRNLGDLWLAPALLIAMRQGLPLRVADPVSGRRRADLEFVQTVMQSWYPQRMSRVQLRMPPPQPPSTRARGLPWRRKGASPDQRGVGACFTGGVDSFHTFVKNRGAITHLIYGHGLDVPEGEEDFRAKVDAMQDAVAAESGIPVLRARTNIKSALRAGRVSWGFEGHSAALASLATVFAPLVRRVLVPSTHSYADLRPWGSHALIDPRWSTPRLAVVHDGAEAERIQKTEALVDDPTAQRHLRVCYRQYESFNCGRCEKCLRTMATIHLLGDLSRFKTFRTEDLQNLETLELTDERTARHFYKIHRLAEQRAPGSALTTTIRGLLDRYEASPPT